MGEKRGAKRCLIYSPDKLQFSRLFFIFLIVKLKGKSISIKGKARRRVLTTGLSHRICAQRMNDVPKGIVMVGIKVEPAVVRLHNMLALRIKPKTNKNYSALLEIDNHSLLLLHLERLSS